MTQSPREEVKHGLQVLLLALNGDVSSAARTVARQFPSATIINIPRTEIENQPFLKRIQALRSHRPDIFAVFMDNVRAQRGQNLARLLGAIAGAKQIVMLDARGGLIEETRQQVLLKTPQRLAREAALSAKAIVTSQRRLGQLEAAFKTSPVKPAASDARHPNIMFLRATPGAGTQAGGAATHINGFINAAMELGASVRVIANDEIAGLDSHRVALTVFPLEPTGLTRSAFDLHNNLSFTQQVLSELRGPAPDLIYQRYSRFTSAGIEASLKTKRPLFLEYNGSEVWVGKHWDDAGMFPLLERFERLNLNSATRIFVVSEVERRNLLKIGVADQKIVVNPNGVDVESFRPNIGGKNERARLNVSDNETLVGFIGTFGPWHGVLELARAIAKLPKQGTRFLLIGDGKLRQEAEQIIATAGRSDRVILTGTIKHSSVPALLDACDVLVSPHIPLADGSDFFGSPTKIFEYMAMGKGIVASRLGQLGDVLTHEQTALLVEPGDVEQLADSIQRMADSPDLAARLGAAARERAIERHTWKRNAQKVLDAYREWQRERLD